MNLLLAFLLIVLEGVFEGLKTAGLHYASEIVEVVYLTVVTLTAIAWLNKKYIFKVKADRFMIVVIGYFLLRFSLFDSIWNIAAGQDFFYYGSTKLYDQVMTKLGTFGWMLKGIAGFWGIAWIAGWREGIVRTVKRYFF
jgi:hypothetical protein